MLIFSQKPTLSQVDSESFYQWNTREIQAIFDKNEHVRGLLDTWDSLPVELSGRLVPPGTESNRMHHVQLVWSSALGGPPAIDNLQ